MTAVQEKFCRLVADDMSDTKRQKSKSVLEIIVTIFSFLSTMDNMKQNEICQQATNVFSFLAASFYSMLHPYFCYARSSVFITKNWHRIKCEVNQFV